MGGKWMRVNAINVAALRDWALLMFFIIAGIALILWVDSTL